MLLAGPRHPSSVYFAGGVGFMTNRNTGLESGHF